MAREIENPDRKEVAFKDGQPTRTCDECGEPADHHKWDGHWCSECFYQRFNDRNGMGHYP